MAFPYANITISKEVVTMPDVRGEQGQGLVEYAFIFVLVVIIVIVLVYLFGVGVGDLYSDVITAI